MCSCVESDWKIIKDSGQKIPTVWKGHSTELVQQNVRVTERKSNPRPFGGLKE
jgi:hypothetical protein